MLETLRGRAGRLRDADQGCESHAAARTNKDEANPTPANRSMPCGHRALGTPMAHRCSYMNTDGPSVFMAPGRCDRVGGSRSEAGTGSMDDEVARDAGQKRRGDAEQGKAALGEKAALRERLRAARAALTADERSLAGREL